MEFQGRIAKLLPMRSGVSQRTGNEWRSLPFVFEYFENPTDRYADSVVLETFDTKVIDNLKEGMEVRCGFSHKAREFTKQDGTTATINEIRLYKIESVRKAAVAQQQTQPSQPATAQQPQPEATQMTSAGFFGGAQSGDDDDLPF